MLNWALAGVVLTDGTLRHVSALSVGILHELLMRVALHVLHWRTRVNLHSWWANLLSQGTRNVRGAISMLPRLEGKALSLMMLLCQLCLGLKLLLLLLLKAHLLLLLHDVVLNDLLLLLLRRLATRVGWCSPPGRVGRVVRWARHPSARPACAQLVGVERR